jgi:hypothetical protein
MLVPDGVDDGGVGGVTEAPPQEDAFSAVIARATGVLEAARRAAGGTREP